MRLQVLYDRTRDFQQTIRGREEAKSFAGGILIERECVDFQQALKEKIEVGSL